MVRSTLLSCRSAGFAGCLPAAIARTGAPPGRAGARKRAYDVAAETGCDTAISRRAASCFAMEWPVLTILIFPRLPFAPNKGEALIVEVPRAGNEGSRGQERHQSRTPGGRDAYWAGSSYEWSFEDVRPTELFRQRTEATLQNWLKLPFRVHEHFASVRPATLERRPFVGFHPLYPSVGLLNGMGTKGCSLAPYFARQLRENIVNGTPILPEANATIQQVAKPGLRRIICFCYIKF